MSIAHNERAPGGPSVAKVLLPLGREDRLDVAGLRRLVGSINRYLGDDPGSDAGVQVGAEPGGGPEGGLTITDSRPAGGAWLLDGLWHQLGIGTALREVLGAPVRHRRRAGHLRAGGQPGPGPGVQAGRRGVDHPRRRDPGVGGGE